MKIDVQAQEVILELFQKFETNSELLVASPEYDQLQIDYFIDEGFLSKIDTSSMSGWAYLVKPTYKGKTYISHLKQSPVAKLCKFIKRGEDIGKKEYHPAGNGFPIAYVSGPLYNTWMDEINIYNERYLKDHPMHEQIFQTYFHRKNRLSAYDDMMGHLTALLNDDEFTSTNCDERWTISTNT